MSKVGDVTVPAKGSQAKTSSQFEDILERPGARLVGGGAWQTVAQIAPFAMTTLVSIVAARALGPDAMGRQSYIAFIVLATVTVASAGFTGTIPRYIAELIGKGDEGRVASLCAWAWRVELTAAAIATLFLLAVAAAGATPRLAWVFGAVGAAAGILHKVPGSILVGTQRWRQSAFVILVSGVGVTVATVVVLLLGGGITSMFVVLAIGNCVMALWAWLISRRLVGTITAPRLPLGRLRREMLRFMSVAAIPMVLNFVVFQRTEFFFLQRHSTDQQIAVYSIAFSVYAALLALPSGLGNMIAPAVATLHGANEHDRIRNGYGRALRLLLFIVIPLTAAGIVFGPPLIRLVYGSQYSEAGNLLLVLMIPLLIVPLGGVSGGLLFGYGRIRAPLVIGIVAAVIDVTLAATLIPRLNAYGASVANISAQIGAALLGITYCVRLVGGVQLAPRHVARMVLAALIAGGCGEIVLYLVGGAAGLVLAVPAAALVYAGLAGTLGILPREDADWLAGAVRGRTRKWTGWAFRRLSGAPLGVAR